jgi:hypothetical protein
MVKNIFDDSWPLPGLLDLATPACVFPARERRPQWPSAGGSSPSTVFPARDRRPQWPSTGGSSPATVFPARDQVTFDFMVKKVVIEARFNKP